MSDMTKHRSVTSSVEVPADCATAFKVFTEELGCWWLPGPINFHDATRACSMRLEPGVGGRVLEVYDAESGNGREIARITEWLPPTRVAWASSLDDVVTEVAFTESSAGTTVSVIATIPVGGSDEGGTAWIRVVPTWLARWFDRRDRVAHVPEVFARLAVAVHYAEPGAAARWLRDVFGLEPASSVPDDGNGHGWIEFRAGNCAIIVLPRELAPGDDEVSLARTAVVPWVFVDDLDTHFAHATASGATIEVEIWHHGARAYEASDLEGNRWTFAQAGPTTHLNDAAPSRSQVIGS